jgi:hypothetical protein
MINKLKWGTILKLDILKRAVLRETSLAKPLSRGILNIPLQFKKYFFAYFLN